MTKIYDVDGNVLYENRESFLGINNAIALKKNFTNAISALNNLRTLPVIVHTSDVHGDSMRFARAYNLAKRLGVDAFVCTGDMVRYNSTDDYSFVTSAVDNSVPYLQCLGNHDTFNYATEEEVYNKFIKPWKDDVTLPQDVTYPTYYYKDDANKKLRIISANQFQSVTNSNTNHNTVHFHQEQITWFVTTLLATPANYGVIVLMHTPEQKPVMDNTYTKFMQKNVPFWDSVRYKPITEIVDAFISGGTLSKTYNNGSGYTPSSFTVSADFSTKNTGVEFVAYMTGHMHSDNVSYVPNTTNKQLMLNVVCTNIWVKKTTDGSEGPSYPYYNELNDLGRMDDEESQDAFNVYAIDRSGKNVKIARIGACMPYDFSEIRDCMVIPYSD